MSRHIVTPADVDFVSVGRRDYHVKFEHPTLWGHYLVPVTVVVGPDAADGEGLVAIGATHGNEYEGPVAIKHIMHDLDVSTVTGRLVLIPVLNASAFSAGTRDTPDDGMNLNRAFPGNPAGSITQRFAAFINDQVFPHVHVVIDLHAGGRVARFPMVSSFHHVSDPAQKRAMEQCARGFGVPFVMIYQDQTPGLLTSTAERLGKVTIGSEFGWGMAVNATGVSMAIQGIRTAAVVHGIIAGELPENAHCPAAEQKMIDSSNPACSMLAPFAGHFEPIVALGAHVTTGQRLGWLHDFNHVDRAPHSLDAPHDGYIVCQAWNATVIQGQVITQVAIETAWSS